MNLGRLTDELSDRYRSSVPAESTHLLTFFYESRHVPTPPTASWCHIHPEGPEELSSNPNPQKRILHQLLHQRLAPPRRTHLDQHHHSSVPVLSNSILWQVELLQGQLNTAPLSTMPSEEVLARGAPMRTSELRRTQTIRSVLLTQPFQKMVEDQQLLHVRKLHQ